jgi:Regulator of chromosome condensation (RCC1) repeat
VNLSRSSPSPVTTPDEQPAAVDDEAADDDGKVRLRGVAQITAGREHTGARMNDGTVSCWGRNDWIKGP